MAQYGRPDIDVSATNFAGFSATTPGSFYTNIDESSADDSDYVYTLTTGASYECGLSDVSDPGVHTGHVYRWRVALSGPLGPGEDPVDYTVSLYEGATLIASHAGSIGVATVTAASDTLSSGEAAAITDYTDLRLRFAVASATSPAVRFAWAELEVPDAASDATLTPDPAPADAGANDPTPTPGGTILLPDPAPADAEGNDPAPVPAGVILSPSPAEAEAVGVDAGVSAVLEVGPAVAYARSPGAAVDDGATRLLLPVPAAAGTSRGMDADFVPGEATLAPAPAAAFADAGGVEHADNGDDGGRVLTPESARAEAETPPDPTPTFPGRPKRRMAGCRCTCPMPSLLCFGCNVPIGDLAFSLMRTVVSSNWVACGPSTPYTQSVSGALQYKDKPLFTTGPGATKIADYHWVYGPFCLGDLSFGSGTCPPDPTFYPYLHREFFYRAYVVVTCGSLYISKSIFEVPGLPGDCIGDGGYHETESGAAFTKMVLLDRYDTETNSCSPLDLSVSYSGGVCPHPVLPFVPCAAIEVEASVTWL